MKIEPSASSLRRAHDVVLPRRVRRCPATTDASRRRRRRAGSGVPVPSETVRLAVVADVRVTPRSWRRAGRWRSPAAALPAAFAGLAEAPRLAGRSPRPTTAATPACRRSVGDAARAPARRASTAKSATAARGEPRRRRRAERPPPATRGAPRRAGERPRAPAAVRRRGPAASRCQGVVCAAASAVCRPRSRRSRLGRSCVARSMMARRRARRGRLRPAALAQARERARRTPRTRRTRGSARRASASSGASIDVAVEASEMTRWACEAVHRSRLPPSSVRGATSERAARPEHA